MSWKTTPWREADVLTLAGLGPCRGTGAVGPPPSPLNPSALTCPVPTGPLALVAWRITTEGSGQTSHAAMPPGAASARPRPPVSLAPSSPRRGRSVRRARRFCSPRWRATAPAGPSPPLCATCTGGCGLILPPPHSVGHAQLLHSAEVLVQEPVSRSWRVQSIGSCRERPSWMVGPLFSTPVANMNQSTVSSPVALEPSPPASMLV